MAGGVRALTASLTRCSYAVLSGRVDDVYGPVDVHFEPNFGMNTVYFHLDYLDTGRYTLDMCAVGCIGGVRTRSHWHICTRACSYTPSLARIASLDRNYTEVQCLKLSLAYKLNVTARVEPPACSSNALLPTDLWSRSGGALLQQQHSSCWWQLQ